MVGHGCDDTGIQDVIHLACHKAQKRKKSTGGKWQSLQDRLLDCYVESCEGAPKDKRFCHGVRLLEKIVLQDNLSALVVNLYPGNEGYSLMLKGKNGTESETIKLPYEESEFLDYLDAQELPPILVDLLDKAQADVFYSGCVVVEVRDYRLGQTGSSYDSNYVLLQPTYQTLVCDINSLTSDSKWTPDDKLVLESQLLLATEAPLCLNPSLEVLHVANQLQFDLRKWNTHGIKRSTRQHSQAFLSRSLATSLQPAPTDLTLLDFLSHYKKSQPPVNLRLAKTPQTTDIWRQKPLHLATPQRVDVDLYAKMVERPKMVLDNTPESVQETTLEGEKTNNRNYFCRVTIRRRPTDLQYLGELYLEEDTSSTPSPVANIGASDESGKGGRACSFSLGSKLNAQKYLQQFQDLYTEEGRKSVKICTYIPQGNQTSQNSTQTSMASTAENHVEANSKGQPARTTANGTNRGSVISTAIATKTHEQLVSQTSAVSSQAAAVSRNVKSSNLSGTWTYGQKLAMFQQQQKLQGVLPTSSAQFVVTSTTPCVSGVPLKARTITTGPVAQYTVTSQTTANKQVLSPTKTAIAASAGRRVSHVDVGSVSNPLQSPTKPNMPYAGVVGTYVQPMVGSGGVNVTVPAGMTVTVPGATTANLTSGGLPAQFVTTGLKTTTPVRQTAPGAPLTLLQATAIQSQAAQVTQGRAPTTTFTLPGNLVQIPSGTLNAQIQPKTSPQGGPTVQPTHILPNTVVSSQSGLTTVTLNARPILPQQQQRKINPVSRTQNLQPIVSLGTGQIPQQQLHFRMVQLNQPPGQPQIQQQTMVPSQVGAVQAVQIHAGQVIPSQSGTVVQQVHVHTKPVQQTRPGQQTQSAQATIRAQSKSPGQRRRSQNK